MNQQFEDPLWLICFIVLVWEHRKRGLGISCGDHHGRYLRVRPWVQGGIPTQQCGKATFDHLFMCWKCWAGVPLNSKHVCSVKGKRKKRERKGKERPEKKMSWGTLPILSSSPHLLFFSFSLSSLFLCPWEEERVLCYNIMKTIIADNYPKEFLRYLVPCWNADQKW